MTDTYSVWLTLPGINLPQPQDFRHNKIYISFEAMFEVD